MSPSGPLHSYQRHVQKRDFWHTLGTAASSGNVVGCREMGHRELVAETTCPFQLPRPEITTQKLYQLKHYLNIFQHIPS